MSIFNRSLGGGNDLDSYIVVDYPEYNWVKFNKGIHDDPNMNLTLIGFYSFFCTHDHSWQIKPRHIMEKTNIGKDSYYKYINQLVKFGYMHKYQTRSEDGKFSQTKFFVFSSPESKKKIMESENIKDLLPLIVGDNDAAKPPCTENKETVNPVQNQANIPCTENKETVKTASYIDCISNNINTREEKREKKGDSPFFSSINDFPQRLKPLFSEVLNEILTVWPTEKRSMFESIRDCAIFFVSNPRFLPTTEQEIMDMRMAAKNHLQSNEDDEKYNYGFPRFLKEWRLLAKGPAQSSYIQPQLTRADIQFREFLSMEKIKNPRNVELFHQAKQDEVIMRQIHNSFEHMGLEKNTKDYLIQEYVHWLRLRDSQEARS